MTDRDLIERVKAALATEEDGENLVAVARAAWLAEVRSAMPSFGRALRALVDEWCSRGADPVEMISALNDASNNLPHPADTGPINDS